MNKIPKLLFLFTIILLSFNCQRGDGTSAIPLRDFQEQYDTDIVDIEDYLKGHSFTVVNNPGSADDQNVIFTKIPEGDTTTPSVWDSPLLQTWVATYDEVDYTIYYLKLREGGGSVNDKPSPTNVDAILTSYSGSYIFHFTDPDTQVEELRTFEFETVPFPQANLSLEGVIRGWREIFPKFKAGDIVTSEGEPINYSNFGAGVMFLPSGMGYYNASQSAIPAYSPLIFSFKLYEVTRLDQDGDGIPSYLEDLNGDGYIKLIEEGTVNPDDTDGDLAPDYLDLDDDGDFFLTKVEIQRPMLNPNDPNEIKTYYPYNGAAVDDPLTPYDDRLGIPDCSGNYTDPLRIRKHLDPDCH